MAQFPRKAPFLNCASGDQDTQCEGVVWMGDMGKRVLASTVGEERWFMGEKGH